LQRHVLQTGRQLCRVHDRYKALQVGCLCPHILHDNVRERGWVYCVISEELLLFDRSLVEPRRTVASSYRAGRCHGTGPELREVMNA